MSYRFKPTEGFWESFYDLPARQKDSARRAWKVFKKNPFDPRLRPHKLNERAAPEGPLTVNRAESRAMPILACPPVFVRKRGGHNAPCQG